MSKTAAPTPGEPASGGSKTAEASPPAKGVRAKPSQDPARPPSPRTAKASPSSRAAEASPSGTGAEPPGTGASDTGGASAAAGTASIGGGAAPKAARSKGKAGASDGDDLKRIRGIGPQNEKRLKAEGITRFGQIAAWTADDARQWGERLSFAGRIEREEWIEQARTLAGGGETDFSKRVDKGSVRTSLERDDPRYQDR